MIQELLVKALEGDEDAENRIFRDLLERFRVIAKHRIWEGDAEDIAQDACLTVLQKYKHEKFSKGFEEWAYGVLRMKIGNYIKGSRRARSAFNHYQSRTQEPSTASPEGALMMKVALEDCLKQMEEKNPRYAQALRLYRQGYSVNEICASMQLERKNLYLILHRGRAMLRECIRKRGIGE